MPNNVIGDANYSYKSLKVLFCHIHFKKATRVGTVMLNVPPVVHALWRVSRNWKTSWGHMVDASSLSAHKLHNRWHTMSKYACTACCAVLCCRAHLLTVSMPLALRLRAWQKMKKFCSRNKPRPRTGIFENK